jgi:hypothetical protein
MYVGAATCALAAPAVFARDDVEGRVRLLEPERGEYRANRPPTESAGDPRIVRRNGTGPSGPTTSTVPSNSTIGSRRRLATWGLYEDHGFTDADGSQPDPLVYASLTASGDRRTTEPRTTEPGARGIDRPQPDGQPEPVEKGLPP